MFLSIIVPVYNVERYIKVTLDSLVKQTKKNFEVIIVNDGSTDASGEICKKYELEYHNFFYFEKNNGGLSDARNYGINKSNGKYIMFLDGDDYIEPNSCEEFEKIVQSIDEEIEIIVGNAKRIENNDSTLYKVTSEVDTILTGKEYLKNEFKANTIIMAACFKLYLKSYLTKYNFKFVKKMLHEDEEFTPKVLLKAKRVLVTDLFFYNYVIRSGSITQVKNKNNNGLDIIKISKKLLIYLDEEESDQELKYLYENYIVGLILSAFIMLDDENRYDESIISNDLFRQKRLTNKNKLKVFLFKFSRKFYLKLNQLV